MASAEDILLRLEQYGFPNNFDQGEIWGVGIDPQQLTLAMAEDLDTIIGSESFRDLYFDIQQYLRMAVVMDYVNMGGDMETPEEGVIDLITLKYTDDEEYVIEIEVNREHPPEIPMARTMGTIVVDRDTMLEVLRYLRQNNIPIFDILGNSV